MAVRTLSLCAGLAALERAVDDVFDARAVCFVEREAYAAAALVARMAESTLDHAPVWDDLATFDGRRFRGCVDLVVAGFPCQPASVAGRHSGASDERWLWPHVWRITRECDAPMLLVENVPRLLAVNDGEAFKEILECLAARGWDAEWDCVPAAAVGAIHARDRLFMLAADTDRVNVRQLAEWAQRSERREAAAERQHDVAVHDGGALPDSWIRWSRSVGRLPPVPSVRQAGPSSTRRLVARRRRQLARGDSRARQLRRVASGSSSAATADRKLYPLTTSATGIRVKA